MPKIKKKKKKLLNLIHFQQCSTEKESSQLWWVKKAKQNHCVKSVQIHSFFCSVFSCIWNEHRKIRTRKNSAFGHFSRKWTRFWKSTNVVKFQVIYFRGLRQQDSFPKDSFNGCSNDGRLERHMNLFSSILQSMCDPLGCFLTFIFVGFEA